MNHYTKEQWISYISGEVNEIDQQMYEDHLYACELCLVDYMAAMEEVDGNIASYENTTVLADEVFQKLDLKITSDIESSNPPPSKFYEKVWFHYGIAAAATIILMFTGVFQQLSGVTTAFEKSDKPNTSITKNIMDRTLSIFDELGKENKESE